MKMLFINLNYHKSLQERVSGKNRNVERRRMIIIELTNESR